MCCLNTREHLCRKDLRPTINFNIKHDTLPCGTAHLIEISARGGFTGAAAVKSEVPVKPPYFPAFKILLNKHLGKYPSTAINGQ